MPDARRPAAAVSARCAAYVSGGRAVPRVPGLRILQIGDCALSP
jgi:hypothetical protein